MEARWDKTEGKNRIRFCGNCGISPYRSLINFGAVLGLTGMTQLTIGNQNDYRELLKFYFELFI